MPGQIPVATLVLLTKATAMTSHHHSAIYITDVTYACIQPYGA